MARKVNPPRSATPIFSPDKRQLADLATLLGLMQSASKLSQELDALANDVGGSLEKIAERFGMPFFDVHDEYVSQVGGAEKRRKKRSADQPPHPHHKKAAK
jgi:hypothetical protein